MHHRDAGQPESGKVSPAGDAGGRTVQSAPPFPTAIRTSTRRCRSASQARCAMPSGPTSSTTRSTAMPISPPRGPEIWEQTNGKVDAFVAASGTGGTLAGTSEYLKSRNRAIRCVLADPPGSSLYEFVRNGALKSTGSGSITEASASRVSPSTSRTRRWMTPSMSRTATRSVTSTGCCAKRVCSSQHQRHQRCRRRAGGARPRPGTPLSPVLCDGGAKYQSRLFNREWLESKGLAAQAGLNRSYEPILRENVLVA